MVLAAAGFYSGQIAVPDTWNPWASLKIREPLNWLTRLKLARLTRDEALCRVVLDTADLHYERVADRAVGRGCGWVNAVRVKRTSVHIGEPFTLTCRTAVALALWETHVLQPAAMSHFADRVVRIEHFGSYVCRNIYGREDAPLSQHATADAIDVAAFVLEKGRHVRVATHWGSSEREGLFLRDLRDGACRVFDGVLGPEYNAAHRDHFHFDRGGWRACR